MAGLVYHAGALGDFITTLPAIARWRSRHPGEAQILLGRPAHAAIAPPFDDVWDSAAAVFAPLFSGSAAPGTPLADLLSPVSSALLFASPSSPLSESLHRLGVRNIARQNPFPDSAIHVVDYHLGLFSGDISDDERAPRIAAVDPGHGLDLRATAAIHCGSGSAKKNWPLERFIELARLLVERGMTISWITGPADRAMTTGPAADAWENLPLPLLAARLARCGLYVGNDSGVTHLAAAAGCPTVALFGESDPLVWAPRGPRVVVIGRNHHGMEAIRVRDVFRVCVDCLNEK